MKKILITLLAALAVCPVMAQDLPKEVDAPQEQLLVYENPMIPVYLGEFTYEPLTKGQKTANVITGLLNDEVSVEDESMVAGAKEALAGCLKDVNRFQIFTGEPSAENLEKGCLQMTGKVIFCNVTERLNDKVMDKEARIVAYITLINPKTKQVVMNKQVVGAAWLSVFHTMAALRDAALNNLWVDAARSLRRGYPLRGHMLEKGFEKGKKQKLKEFYIDLGSQNRLFTNSTVDVYTVKRVAGRIARQYIGSGKVLEVQGDDISICKVTRNADLIKNAWDRGAEIAVSVY
ncbi:MAG: hypothetical protein MJZ83_03410 [Bacteroidaceae bacterium]|nr:hypothetical protein [Bacteroidaceae bacterium]